MAKVVEGLRRAKEQSDQYLTPLVEQRKAVQGVNGAPQQDGNAAQQ